MVNYEFLEQADGTYTIPDFEIASVGEWEPRWADGVKRPLYLNESALEAMAEADARTRKYFKPPVIHIHSDSDKSLWIGALGPMRRAGNKLLGDLRGLTGNVKAWMESGQAGRQSPEIKFGIKEPATGVESPIAVLALAFTGPEQPAMTDLKSLVSYGSGNGEHGVLLDQIDKDGLSGVARFAGVHKLEDDMSDELKDQLAKLKADLAAANARADKVTEDAGTAAEKSKDELKAAQDANHKRLVAQFLTQVALKLDPKEVESTEAIAMSMASDQVGAYFEQISKRPDHVAKPTGGAGATPSGAEPEKVDFDTAALAGMNAMCAANPGMSMPNAVTAWLDANPDRQEQYEKEWRPENFPVKVAQPAKKED